MTTATAHEEWDRRWALDEGRAAWLESSELAQPTVALLRERGLHRVLDLGCGVGRHALYFAREGFDVTACDASRAGRNVATRSVADQGLMLRFKQCPMTDLPFKNNAFDYVLAFDVLRLLGRDVAPLLLEDRQQDPGGWHWHLLADPAQIEPAA